MPNAIYCYTPSTTEDIDFSGQSFPIGTIITATVSPPSSSVVNYCFEITDNSSVGGAAYTATTTTYTSCYECLANNFTIITFDPCVANIGFSFSIPITQLGIIPSESQVFYVNVTYYNGNTQTFCASVSQFEQASEDDYINSFEPGFSTINQIINYNFSLGVNGGCNECLYGFSSGTESTICNICCPCTTGETVNSVSVPHPDYSNGLNQTIKQLNAITIGGFNGLNN